jgi:alginate O-acetyltransferase complex protein AlgI
MSFITLEFALFFCGVTLIYFLTPLRLRWLVLLVAGYLFYATWNLPYIGLLLFSTLCNYFVAKAIHRSTDRRGLLLFLGIVINLGILLVFKYFNFFNDSIGAIFQGLNIQYAAHLDLLLPVGVSFYTFMGMAYIIDVYRGKIEPEKHFGLFAVFIAFFPQLVSGPISRAPGLLPQFRQPATFDENRVIEGLRRILWGAFKKIVIADRLAVYVNQVYGHPQDYHGPALIMATVFFAFQIYADFSGYTDIALGLARILGFKLMDNFKQPYFSLSLTEFWQRWHISLSTWIRDYLFFPMARKGLSLTHGRYPRLVQLSVSVIAMCLCGLWHGASWTFVIWGLLHGVFMGMESALKGKQGRLAQVNSHLLNAGKLALTFTLVCVAWIFFRANTLGDAQYILGHLFSWSGSAFAQVTSPFIANTTSRFAVAMLLVGLIVAADVIDRNWGIDGLLNRSPKWVRWGLYYGATASILLLGVWGGQEFLYFRF